jgi:hypothetical protein
MIADGYLRDGDLRASEIPAYTFLACYRKSVYAPGRWQNMLGWP